MATRPARTLKRLVVVLALLAPTAVLPGDPAAAAGGPLVSTGSVRLSSLVGPAGSGNIANPEFAQSIEEDHATDGGKPAPRHRRGPSALPAPVAPAGPEAAVTFAGLNHRDNRLANRGNQFSLEPPDQALCVGPSHVLEGVNTVMRVYDKRGGAVSPTIAFNEFFGYPPAIDRRTGTFGAFLTDPVCHFDQASGRFFLAVLTLDQDPTSGSRSARRPTPPGFGTGTPCRYRTTGRKARRTTTATATLPCRRTSPTRQRASVTTRTLVPTATAST